MTKKRKGKYSKKSKPLTMNYMLQASSKGPAVPTLDSAIQKEIRMQKEGVSLEDRCTIGMQDAFERLTYNLDNMESILKEREGKK